MYYNVRAIERFALAGRGNRSKHFEEGQCGTRWRMNQRERSDWGLEITEKLVSWSAP